MSIRLMTDEQYATLVDTIDEQIRALVDHRAAQLLGLTSLRTLADALAKSTRDIPLRFEDFRNATAVLHAIDLPELQAAGLFVMARNVDSRVDHAAAHQWRDWVRFRTGPVAYLIAIEDDIRDKIWEIVQRRMKL